MKKCILSFVLGVILTSIIGTVAYSYNAKDIVYTPSNTSWKVDNIKSAIDSIKSTNDTTITSLTEQVSNLQLSNSSKDDEITSLTTQLANNGVSKTGTFESVDKNTIHNINLGFRASKIIIFNPTAVSGAVGLIFVYDTRISNNLIGCSGYYDQSAGNCDNHTSNASFTVSDTGFTFKAWGETHRGTYYWSAVK